MSETFDAAQEALASGLPADEEPDQPVVAESESTDQEPEPDVPPSKEVDISHLPEEAQVFIRAREREMQADATRKWQEAAELRRQAEESIAFVQALNSDPSFAMKVHEYLDDNLAAAGFLEEDTEDVYGEGSDPYQAEIADLQQWKAQIQEQMQVAELSAQLDRQLMQVQADNPKWDQSDFDAVIDLGFATGGDLVEAAKVYQAIQDRSLQRYLESKGSVTAPPQVTGRSGTPVPPALATDDELRQAALERIRSELS
jgi:hypothetical protein